MADAVHELFCSIGPDGVEFVAGQYPRAGVLDDMSLVASHVDGSEKREIFRPPTSAPVWATNWARHADLIAFTVGPIFAPDEAVVDIWTVHGDVGEPDGPPTLFQEYHPSVHPRFSPDGKWLVFASRRAWLNDEAPLSHGNSQPYGEIFVAPVDGSAAPIRLTHNRWEDSVPCWGVMPRP
jgi:hypothetical protein